VANKFCDSLLTTGANDGSTLDDAYKSIETALEAALSAGDKLYIRRRSGFWNPSGNIAPLADGNLANPIQAIGGPRRAEFGEAIFEQESNIIRTVSKRSNLIDRGDCESSVTPMVFGETVPQLTNATFTRSAEQKNSGNYSYKIIKTIDVGQGIVRFIDVTATDDMHGLIAGETYTLEAWVYIPTISGLALNEIKIFLYDYQGGWQSTPSTNPTSFDTWQKLTVTRTLRGSATGTSATLLIESAASINEYLYIDDIKLIEHDISTELIPKLEQHGTRMIKNDVDGRKYMTSAIAHKINYDGLSGLFTEGLMVTGAGGCEGKIHKLEENIAGNYIDRADCENVTPPMVTPETVPYTWNATFTRNNEQQRNGFYSYKGIKTSASGVGSVIDLTDNDLTTDLHGLVPGEIYTWEVWIYIPSASGIDLDQVDLRLRDYQGGWAQDVSNIATAFDIWQKLTVTRTTRAAATGINLRFGIGSGAGLNEYWYVDDIRLRNLGEETGSLWIVSKARELIDRGNCEDPIPPVIFNEFINNLSDATFVRDSSQKRNGDFSYKFTRLNTNAAWADLQDNALGNDMHGLVAGMTYTWDLWVYIPSSGGVTPGNVTLRIYDYDVGWDLTASAPASVTDSWEKLTVTRTFRSGAVGVAIRLYSDAEEASKYFYVDDITLKNVFLDNEEITDEDTGVADVDGTPADEGFVILNNYAGDDSTDKIDRGDCESETPPMVTPETVPFKMNATFARSIEQKRNGTYSYKMVKTTVPGTALSIYLVDNLDNDDLHGLVPGETYTYEVWVYVPSVNGFAVYLQIGDEDGGFQWSWVLSTLTNTWEKLSVTRTIRAGATAIRVGLFSAGAEAQNDYAYVDDIQLIEHSDFTIERDEDYDSFQAIDDSAWTIKKADWNGDAEDLPIMNFGASAYKLYIHISHNWVYKNLVIRDSSSAQGTMYILLCNHLMFKSCIINQNNNKNCIQILNGYASAIYLKQTLVIGSDGGNAQHGIYTTAGLFMGLNLIDVALYNFGKYGLVCCDTLVENLKVGVELPNGGSDIYMVKGLFLSKNVGLGGKNGYTFITPLSTIYIGIENFNALKVHNRWCAIGQINKRDVVIGSGDPYKRSGGADSVIEISCNISAAYAPAPDEWKYLIFEHEFEMDAALRNYRYYVQCKAMSIASSSELYLECEYVDQYVDSATYHTTKVKSDELIALRSGADDWSQYLEVIGIQPAVASKVRIKCYLSKYDADGRIFIDPKVVLS